MSNQEESHNHNNIEQPRRSYKRLLLIAVLLIAGVTGGLFYDSRSIASQEQKQEQKAPSMPPMPVETAQVKVTDSATLLSAVGSLRSNEAVVIAAEINGRIKAIGFDEGLQVKRGKMLIQLDSSVLQAELDQAEANRNLSLSTFKRTENLLKDKAVSQQERDEAYAQWQLNEARLRLARAQLDKTTIRAPFSGTLGLRQVSPGDYIQPGQTLTSLEAIKQLKVEFAIPERHIAAVKVGQKITLTSDAYPEREFISEVYAIDPRVDANSRSLTVRGRLDNSQRELLPGQFVRVELQVATRSNALMIPEQALIPQLNAKLVYRVIDGKADMVKVETGTRSKGWVEIVSGLNANDMVITGGHQKIGPGSPVKAIEADPELFAQID